VHRRALWCGDPTDSGGGHRGVGGGVRLVLRLRSVRGRAPGRRTALPPRAGAVGPGVPAPRAHRRAHAQVRPGDDAAPRTAAPRDEQPHRADRVPPHAAAPGPRPRALRRQFPATGSACGGALPGPSETRDDRLARTRALGVLRLHRGGRRDRPSRGVRAAPRQPGTSVARGAAEDHRRRSTTRTGRRRGTIWISNGTRFSYRGDEAKPGRLGRRVVHRRGHRTHRPARLAVPRGRGDRT